MELFGNVILASLYASYEAVKYYFTDFGQKISNRVGDISIPAMNRNDSC